MYLAEFDLQKRGEEIDRALGLFSNNFPDISYIDDAAAKITGVYFEILKVHVKPLIPKKVNKFKMASVLALTIIKLQPIQKSDPTEGRMINGDLALFVAMNVILDMAKPDGFDVDYGLHYLESAIKKVKSQHLSWLRLKELNSFPIFPVAAFYFAFFWLCTIRHTALPN